MKELLPLTPEQLARAEKLLRNPPAGSPIEAAREFGIDLTLVISQLRLIPEERVRARHEASVVAEMVRGAARHKRG